MPDLTHRSLAALLLLSACDSNSSSSDPWIAPPQASGKADAPGTLSGADIPSSFVALDASYLHRRSIRALEDVGALDEGELGLATRADGIIAALPTDGRLDIEELVRMEESPFFDLLQPEEQAAFPALWALFEVPETPVIEVEFEAAPFELEDRTTDPDQLQLPDWVAVQDFSEDLRETLDRAQLAFDDDDDEGTVSLADLDEALLVPAAFTPAEVSDLESARLEFLNFGESAASAVVALPRPTLREVEDEVLVGDVVFARVAETTISETRSIKDLPGALYRRTYDVDLEVERKTTQWPVLEYGQHVIAIETSEDREHLLRPEPAHLSGGVYLVELWEGGERTGAHWAALPQLAPNIATLHIPERVGHDFEAPDGEPFVRVLHDTTDFNSTSGDTGTASYRWNVSGQEHTDGVVLPVVVERTELPVAPLLPGRYGVELNGNEVSLDLFPQGAARATLGVETMWMRLHGTDLRDHMAKQHTADFEGGTITFRGASSALDLKTPEGERFSVEVLQSDREG